jgi:hypothetical protein
VIARALDQALRRMWRRWCGGLPAESFMTTAAEAAFTAPGRPAG